MEDKLKEYNKAIESYKKSIKINPKKDMAYSNLFELQLTQNQSFNKELETKYIELFANQKNTFIKYEMLKILQDIVNDKEVKINSWRAKYRGVDLGGWSFDELDMWIGEIKDSKIKNRLMEAVEVFKKHKYKTH